MINVSQFNNIFASFSDDVSGEVEVELRRRRMAMLGGFQMQNDLKRVGLFEDDFIAKKGGGSGSKIGSLSGSLSTNINRKISSLSRQGSQAVVVKIASFASGSVRSSALLEYISREGKNKEELELENELGFFIKGASEINDLVQEWGQDFSERKPSKDVISFEIEFPKETNLTNEQALGLTQDALVGHHHLITVYEDDGIQKASVVALLSGQKKSRLYVDGVRGHKFQENINSKLSGDNTVLINISGIEHGQDGVKKYATIGITKHASMVDENGKIYRNEKQIEALSAKWKHKMQSNRSRDVMHLILSSKPGTDKSDFVNASRDYLRMTYSNHQYQFACHEDKGHFHIHAAIKVTGANNVRLNPNKEDLRHWRENMVVCAQAHGINMYNRDLDRSSYPSYKLKDKYMAKLAGQDNTTKILVAEVTKKPSLVAKLFGKKPNKVGDAEKPVNSKILYPKQFSKSKDTMDQHKDNTSLQPIYSQDHYINLSYTAAIQRALSDQYNRYHATNDGVIADIKLQQEAHKQYVMSDDAHKLIGGISRNIVKLSEYKNRIYSVDGDELNDLEKSQDAYLNELAAFVESNGHKAEHELFEKIVSKGIERIDKQFRTLETLVQFKEENPEFGVVFQTAEAQVKATNGSGHDASVETNENTVSEVDVSVSEQKLGAIQTKAKSLATTKVPNDGDVGKSARWHMAQQIKRDNTVKNQLTVPTEKPGNSRRDMAQQIKRDNAAKELAKSFEEPSNPCKEMAQKIKRENANKSPDKDLER